MSAPVLGLDEEGCGAPPLGGFKAALVRLEVRRLLRNRRTFVFTVIVPVLLFLCSG